MADISLPSLSSPLTSTQEINIRAPSTILVPILPLPASTKTTPKLLPLPTPRPGVNTNYVPFSGAMPSPVPSRTIPKPVATIQPGLDGIIIPTLPAVQTLQQQNLPHNTPFVPQFQKGVSVASFVPPNGSYFPDYHNIIAKSGIEDQLLNNGYTPVVKIVLKDNSVKDIFYVKAVNKKGQKVFVLVDVEGGSFTGDVVLTSSKGTSNVPHSIKTGAYTCAGHDVCGIAFECGNSSVCVLSRHEDELNPVEANYLFASGGAQGLLDIPDNVMSYPIVRLSEILANADVVLENTDEVTRRLRNTAYVSEMQDLAATCDSANKLQEALAAFDNTRQDVVTKLNQTLVILEEWNDIYIANPPSSEEDKEKLKQLQYNLALRNEGISTLLRAIKKVSGNRSILENVARDINSVTEFCVKEFANIEFATTE